MTLSSGFRNRNDVELELQNAKLQNTNPVVYSIVCPVQQHPKKDTANKSDQSENESNFDDDFKVFQLTEQQTQMLLSNGECFTIKGAENEHCSIFSKDKSFTLRSGETSNTLLFVSDVKVPTAGASKDPAETNVITTAVECSSQIYYEITEGRPRLARALQLLMPSSLKMKSDNGSERNDNSVSEAKVKSYTFHELSQAVHASDHELRAYLKERNVMNVDEDIEELKLLEDSYFAHVAMMILRRLEEESYEVGRVPKYECIECLQTLESLDVLQFVFDKLFDRSDCSSISNENTENEKRNDNELFYRLNDKSVCRLFAYYLLSQFDKMSSEQFEQIVCESLPEGVAWNYDHVSDCLITLEAPQKNREIVTYVKYFPEWELPDDPPEKRLTELWSAKGPNSKWTLKELTPLLLPAVGNKQQAVTSLLTKFAKSSNDTTTGQKVFTKRY